jgi:hypothetical protein
VTLLGQVMMRDLGQSPPPHAGQAFITGMYAAPEQRTPEQAKAIACPMRSLMNCPQSGRYKIEPQTEGDRTMKEKTEMTMKTDAETVVRRAYHLAEGNVMDVQGFIDLFAADGVLNAGQESYRGEGTRYWPMLRERPAGAAPRRTPGTRVR